MRIGRASAIAADALVDTVIQFLHRAVRRDVRAAAAIAKIQREIEFQAEAAAFVEQRLQVVAGMSLG